MYIFSTTSLMFLFAWSLWRLGQQQPILAKIPRSPEAWRRLSMLRMFFGRCALAAIADWGYFWEKNHWKTAQRLNRYTLCIYIYVYISTDKKERWTWNKRKPRFGRACRKQQWNLRFAQATAVQSHSSAVISGFRTWHLGCSTSILVVMRFIWDSKN